MRLNKHNYMQQTIPIQSWKEGWSARLSWRRCWRPWMDPARLKKQGGTHKLGTKYICWSKMGTASCFVTGPWVEETTLDVWLSENSSQFPQCFVYNLTDLPLNSLCNYQYILLRPNTRSWTKLSTQHFPFWSPDVFDFLVPCLDGFWRSFFKCFMWHEMYAKHSSKCTVLQLREAFFFRIQPEGSPQLIALSHFWINLQMPLAVADLPVLCLQARSVSEVMQEVRGFFTLGHLLYAYAAWH